MRRVFLFSDMNSIAKFVILQQPYPKPTKQGGAEDLLRIRLLCGAQTGIRPATKATAIMIYENQQTKKSQPVKKIHSPKFF